MSRPTHYVKFNGKFRDLRGMGWHFWKAFASNYRVYTKRPDGSKWGQCLNIWQHHGGYLEVDNCLEYSWLIVDAIAKKEHLGWKITSKIFGEMPARIFINMKENYIFVECDGVDRDAIPRIIYNKDVTEEQYDEYYNTWRELGLLKEVINEIEMLLESGLIEVMPDTRKY